MTTDPTSTRRVLEAIARHLGTDVGTLRGRERTAKVAGDRAVVIVILRQRGLSYRALGSALRRDVAQVFRTHRYAIALPHTRELAEHVDRMLQPAQAAHRTDYEAELARSREAAGCAVAKSTRGRPP